MRIPISREFITIAVLRRLMPGNAASNASNRAKQVAAGAAAVTGGSGVASTGAIGDRAQQATEPAANTAATSVGAEPTLGPVLLLVLAAVILVAGFLAAQRLDD